ncbi:helix-turn-helix domain-containing protein [Afifella sp. H1R]|uniref:helix-turn-helix domain-containing protein n=1 Tax=Afifella sp. H1R TaxID=2908841 RepID=UPI00351CBF05
MPRHVTAAELASEYGMSPRHWTRLAAAGKIPGAWQPGGAGGKWLFDPKEFAVWRRSQRRTTDRWQPSIAAERYGGAAPPGPARNIGSPSAPRIDAWLKRVSETG